MLFWSLAFFFVGTFLLIAIAVVVAWLVLQKMKRQRADEAADSADEGSGPDLFKPDELSSISVWHSLLARFDFAELLRTQITEAEVPWSVGRVTLAMLLCGTVALAVLMRIDFVPLWGAMGGSWVVALIPYFYIRHRRS